MNTSTSTAFRSTPSVVLTWLLMLACCALLLPLQALAGTRLALVIGNSSYADRPLRNPGNDATDVAAALKDLGFELYERKPQLNLNRRSFNAALGGFVRQASGADLVVIYYSGHGLQASGDNYLVPTDARIEEERDIRTEGIRLADLLNDLDDAKVQRTVVILDACRDNPFNSRAKSLKKGLARIEPQGATLIAFATAEGLTADDGSGRHGVYTEALLQNLRDRRLDVRDVLDETALAVGRANKGQRPRVYGDTALFKGVYLGGAGTQVASLQAVPVQPAPNGAMGGSANFGDLERAQKEEAAARQKWATWQSSMKADFNKAASFKGSAELEAKAWERFLAAYAENNPYSDEDEQLRADAERRRMVVCSSGARCTSSPSASSQQAKPNRVYRYSDGQSNGYFEQRGEQWREYHTGPDGRIQLFTTFIEYARDSNYIYLEDRNRSRPGRNGPPDYFLVKVPIAPAPFQWSWRSEENHWNALHLTVPVDRLPD